MFIQYFKKAIMFLISDLEIDPEGVICQDDNIVFFNSVGSKYVQKLWYQLLP